TWEWDGAAWTQVDSTGPSPRAAAGMCFDSDHDQVVLLSGFGATDDTWLRTVRQLRAPVITTQPVSRTASPQGVASFAVVAEGAGALTYQWRRNMINLVDDGRIVGSQTSTLAITAVHTADAGAYDVVIS